MLNRSAIAADSQSYATSWQSGESWSAVISSAADTACNVSSIQPQTHTEDSVPLPVLPGLLLNPARTSSKLAYAIWLQLVLGTSLRICDPTLHEGSHTGIWRQGTRDNIQKSVVAV